MTDEVVTRLYRCLVEELRRRGHSEDGPIKVAALYQDLVPYRSVRSALDVELNADYEHALLRLLAGERGLLRLEPESASAELRKELEAPYPFVGMFRKFAASDVWVTMPATDGRSQPSVAAAAASAPAPLRPAHSTSLTHAAPGAPRLAAQAAVAAPMRIEAAEAATELPLHQGAECSFCEESLPPGRRVRFCPRCGGDQRLRPCPRCEAVLEREWRYCISCGRENGA